MLNYLLEELKDLVNKISSTQIDQESSSYPKDSYDTIQTHCNQVLNVNKELQDKNNLLQREISKRDQIALDWKNTLVSIEKKITDLEEENAALRGD